MGLVKFVGALVIVLFVLTFGIGFKLYLEYRELKNSEELKDDKEEEKWE